MSDLLLRSWIEPIDDKAACACCRITETHRGAIYGASAILLFDRHPRSDKRDALRDVEIKLRREIARHSHFPPIGYSQRHGLPFVGWVRDNDRA